MTPPSIMAIRKRLRQLSVVQEAWGDRSQDILVVPDGFTPANYAKALQACVIYGYPRFRVQEVDGAECVVEENYVSIGD